ncbi:iron ABC transporter permease [Clostridium cochlearium]|uniref:FecCD family ABC transporter permease n=1 Tax=Clostridium cochlearium TaxID=1494 RepID=UPI0017D71BDC|nr:iron ABC transporter permease [Clostridium cochlearium]NMA57843.1 iron ABC transporter permease [Clostridium cochlearium]
MDSLKKTKYRYVSIFILLFIALLVTFILCIILGSVKIETREVFKIIFSKDKKSFDHGAIVWDIRFPRVLATILGGSALAIAGLLLQIFFKNPIVEPYVLGISSGATLCVALVILGGVTFGAKSISPYTIFTAALTGALVVTLIIIIFASRVKNVTTLLVIGIMVGYICSAVTRTLTAFADKEKILGFTLWTMGSFSGFTWKNVRVLLMMGLPALIASFFIVKPLNAFLMGEEYAKSMGVNIKFFRIIIVLISSILTAAVIAFSGPVAFIGLAVPHISRLIFGTSDNKILIPGTILLGAIITSLCDLISRLIFAPIELPISAVTSMFGAPIVIILIMKNRKGSSI